MKRTNYIIAVLSLLIGLSACSSEMPVVVEQTVPENQNIISENTKRSLDEILAIASAYGKTKSFQSRSGLCSTSISSVVPIQATQTRNESDTLMYAVNYSDGNGYVIVSAEKTTEPILAMIDRGSFDASNPNKNEGLEFFLNCASNYVMGSRQSPGIPERTLIPSDHEDFLMEHYCDTIRSVSVSGPRLKVNWNQDWPENMYCPNKVAGCAPVAIAQVLTYFKPDLNLKLTFDEKPCNTLAMEWDHILTHTQSTFYRYPSQKQIDDHVANCSGSYSWHHQIGALVRQIGVWCNSSYNSGATSTETSAMWRTCNSILSEQSRAFATANEFYDRLKDGGVALARGSSFHGGHAWVMDGTGIVESFCWTYYCYNPKTKTYTDKKLDIVHSKYVHCNWGWGGADNGYFLEGVYDTDKGVDYPTRYDFKWDVYGYVYK